MKQRELGGFSGRGGGADIFKIVSEDRGQAVLCLMDLKREAGQEDQLEGYWSLGMSD